MDDRTKSVKQRSVQLGSRAARILADMGSSLEDMYFGLARPGLCIRYGVIGAQKYLSRKEKYYRDLEMRRLEKRGMIKRKKIADEYWVEFSNKGFEEYLMIHVAQADNLPDGQFCLLSFDIPEDQRKLRNYVRYLLRKLGFSQAHKSVWMTKKNVGLYMSRLFLSKFQDANWFKIFLASEM